MFWRVSSLAKRHMSKHYQSVERSASWGPLVGRWVCWWFAVATSVAVAIFLVCLVLHLFDPDTAPFGINLNMELTDSAVGGILFGVISSPIAFVQKSRRVFLAVAIHAGSRSWMPLVQLCEVPIRGSTWMVRCIFGPDGPQNSVAVHSPTCSICGSSLVTTSPDLFWRLSLRIQTHRICPKSPEMST
jgi:hypothetical protein